MSDKTLGAEEILTSRTISRRSAVTTVAYGGLALMGLSAQACGRATGCTDSDTGTLRDAAGHGVHCCTDSDATDAGGHGTHCASTGCTDSDPTDGTGHGRHCI